MDAKSAVAGCIYMETLGCMSADFWCKYMEQSNKQSNSQSNRQSNRQSDKQSDRHSNRQNSISNWICDSKTHIFHKVLFDVAGKEY